MHEKIRLLGLVAAAAFTLMSGCTEAPPQLSHRQTVMGPRTDLPIAPGQKKSYLDDTIMQYTNFSGAEPFPVSGYGLVTHLHGTGGSRVPTPVRAFMIKEMARHDFGVLGSGLMSPDTLLNSKDVAIVRVDGLIPPGARAGADWNTWFDVQVSIPPESDATSLAHGDLYQCDLKRNGADPADPGGGQVLADAQAFGPVFVNPSYLVDSSVDTPAARESRRSGVILGSGRVLQDRPLWLDLRSPSMRMSRAIETRILERFADVVDDDLRPAAGSDAASSKKVANSESDGRVAVYVPRLYTNNWEHFAGVVRHLYMQGDDPAYAANKARELADVAENDKDAKLLDISYAWEGLGRPALYALTPLMSSDKPDVQFAAARAAVFLNDTSAVQVLLSIADTRGNPFRVNAVRTLSELPPTPRVDRLCRTLLDSDEANVRIEAYKLLSKHNDAWVYTRWIKDRDGREVFALDLVRSSGQPLIYATRQGTPRIAVFGSETSLDLPLIFTSMDQKLTISSEPQGSNVTLFYRGDELPRPVTMLSVPNVPEIVRLLAGDSESGTKGMHFSYGDVVGILQQMVDERRVSGLSGQQRLLASFMLQDPSIGMEPMPGGRSPVRPGRQQGDTPSPADQPPDTHLLRPAVGSVDPIPSTRAGG